MKYPAGRSVSCVWTLQLWSGPGLLVFMEVGVWNVKCSDTRAPFVSLVSRTSMSLCARSSVLWEKCFYDTRRGVYVCIRREMRARMVTVFCSLLWNVQTVCGAHPACYSVGAGVKRQGLATCPRLVKVKCTLWQAVKTQLRLCCFQYLGAVCACPVNVCSVPPFFSCPLTLYITFVLLLLDVKVREWRLLDFRHPPRCWWERRSCGTLHTVVW
jgi:hypothetical protein